MDANAPIAGRWDYSYSVDKPHQYGELESYQLAAEWLNPCSEVEDRGCGCAFARQFYTTVYTGVDGSPSRWTDKVVDLMTYRREVPGIQMRHVLEHNGEWQVILRNALNDFTKRMALVVHIPLSPDADHYLAPAVFPGDIAVPNISLSRHDLLVLLAPYARKLIELPNGELIFYLEK